MITYEHISIIKVKIDGKLAGTIKEVKGGWQYYPRGCGKAFAGEVFTSQFAVMQSLQ